MPRRCRGPSLLDMPEVVMKKILEKSDFRSILNLRKVSHDLRNLIDDVKPELNLNIIQIHVDHQQVRLSLSSFLGIKPARIHYLKKENHCEVVSTYRKSTKKWILEEEDYLNTFFKDFKIIISLQSSQVILSFSLIAAEVPAELKNVFTTPLKTEKFAITTSGPDEIMKILPFMDSEVLGEIDICNIHEMANEVWDLEKVVELEQRKKSYSLELVYFYVHLPIHHFLHFSSANIRLLELSADDIFQLKQHYIHNPDFDRFHVDYKTLTNESDQTLLLGPPLHLTEPPRTKWFYNYPRDEVFYILIRRDSKFIYFHKMPRHMTPNDAIIQ